MSWIDPALRSALRCAWDYMKLVHAAGTADAILALGSFDPRVAVTAAALWRNGHAPVIVVSGGLAHKGGLLDTGWDRPEARVFADIALREGVPPRAILIEDRAQNTGDNFVLTRAVAEQAGLRPDRLLVVAKPYMTRRGYATGRKVWPGVDLLMQCEQIALEDYFAREADPERTTQALVGDLHRIMVYPALGFQIEQPVPMEVVHAFRRLMEAGYGERLVPDREIIRGSPPRRPTPAAPED